MIKVEVEDIPRQISWLRAHMPHRDYYADIETNKASNSLERLLAIYRALEVYLNEENPRGQAQAWTDVLRAYQSIEKVES